MVCKHCEKILGGGFKQPDGSFLCAKCTIIKVERSTELNSLERIMALADIAMAPGKRPTKRQMGEIRSQAYSAWKIHTR